MLFSPNNLTKGYIFVSRFRSKLPVVSNLTAMNMWDGVCMFFIYASFIEFILVNYLARWVQDPEQQKKKKENAILDNFLMASKAIEEKKHEMEATMVNLGDKVGSNIQQGLNNLPLAGVSGVMGSAGAGGH